ncbi:MAG: hypothetical protein K2Y56_24155 [Methylobacterium sp.]|uniref:hypothetical protein n=1 Tax=Methylobacterium sp. TaxID=409 RepID=UPI0025DAD8F7|nr:hypothetical protein [Methylobacterium sp.]MBX9934572.1 hypothetical protein [Methylobacterium sp.]
MPSSAKIIPAASSALPAPPSFGTSRLPGQDIFGDGNLRVFLASGTFIVPAGVTSIRVRVHGAGGQGGYNCASTGPAAGGGGGGFAMKTVAVTPGASYAVTVGKGGTRAIAAGSLNGNAGGSSSFGAVCSASGGGGGTYVFGANYNPGGTGGTGTGGDVNYTGGNGGVCSSSTNTAFCTGGGGCATIMGKGGNGGSISGSPAGSYTGGGGALFDGGAVTLSGFQGRTGGGGMGGPAPDNTLNNQPSAGGPSFFGDVTIGGNGPGSSALPTWAISRFIGDALFGGGGAGDGSNNKGGPGAGGGGSQSANTGGGGVFGGGGGSTPAAGFLAHPGGIGGGGGGGYNGSSGAGGPGGDGLVVVEW